MPELPEVEQYRQYMDKTSLNKKIKEVLIKHPKIVEDSTEEEIKNGLTGEKFIETDRRGKYLFAAISNKKFLVMHFGMTGDLDYLKKGDEPAKHNRVLFVFENGEALAMNDQRIFGFVTLIESKENYILEKKLGPDALYLKEKDFLKVMENKKGIIKAVLMDQEVIAGLGNVYVDEALFQSGIHPDSQLKNIPIEKVKELHHHVHEIVKKAVKYHEREDLPENYLTPLRYNDETQCPICKGEIQTKKTGGRTTYYCPKHQKKY